MHTRPGFGRSISLATVILSLAHHGGGHGVARAHGQGPQLARALKDQLIDGYMRTDNSRHGVYVLCSAGLRNRKTWTLAGRRMCFSELVDHLRGEARAILATRPTLAGLEVVGLDFRAA